MKTKTEESWAVTVERNGEQVVTIESRMLRMAAAEQRSVGNTISVLVTEAVLARQRRKQRQRARKAGLKVGI